LKFVERFQIVLKSEKVTDTLLEDCMSYQKHLQWNLSVNNLSFIKVKIPQNKPFYEERTLVIFNIPSS
jgi:hypothetical protein